MKFQVERIQLLNELFVFEQSIAIQRVAGCAAGKAFKDRVIAVCFVFCNQVRHVCDITFFDSSKRMDLIVEVSIVPDVVGNLAYLQRALYAILVNQQRAAGRPVGVKVFDETQGILPLASTC